MPRPTPLLHARGAVTSIPAFGDLELLIPVLRDRRVGVLTGAGCSTESGIPDYRGPLTRSRKRAPMQAREFDGDPAARRRYWARSMVGWPAISTARPNPGHRALAELERHGTIEGLVTQNVDRLHTAAGSRNVVELHGALHEVRCVDCGSVTSRNALQSRLEALNPGFLVHAAELAPDGDAELPSELVAEFVVATCTSCRGVLKPNVVFFGENVPGPIVARARALLEAAEVLLVVGSSLTVYSGYRFVRAAHQRGASVVILNLGPTRGDPEATLRIDGCAGELLPRLAAALRRS